MGKGDPVLKEPLIAHRVSHKEENSLFSHGKYLQTDLELSNVSFPTVKASSAPFFTFLLGVNWVTLVSFWCFIFCPLIIMREMETNFKRE